MKGMIVPLEISETCPTKYLLVLPQILFSQYSGWHSARYLSLIKQWPSWNRFVYLGANSVITHTDSNNEFFMEGFLGRGK